MEWTDDGIVLGMRRHGEANAILELMTQAHGRHLGLVRGGSGSRMRPTLQPGNSVRAQWRARLDEHLGHFTLEGTASRAAALLASSHATYGVTHLAALCRLLPERDPHPQIYDAVQTILDGMEDPFVVATRIVHFELNLLAELGFGLDLDTCAATGGIDELVYVSPRSGRAVSRDAGAPWRDKLMRLPSFLATATEPGSADLADGFALTGFFLRRHVLDPRGIALGPARDGFIAAVLRAMPADS